MADNNQIRVYENRQVEQKDAFSGSDVVPYTVLSGSRMLVTLQVTDIDVGAQIDLAVDNGYSRDVPFDTIQTLSINSVGSVKRIVSDFNNLFDFRYTTSGGAVSFRIAIALYDNAGTTRIENAVIDVDLSHTTDSQGHFDSIRVGDGVDLLQINPDGSINVNQDIAGDESPLWPYAEISAVLPDTETTIITYTVPSGKIAFLYRGEASGENIAHYKLYVNGVSIASKRTYFGGDLNAEFDFNTSNKRSVQLEEGDVVTLKVTHSRPDASDFEARLNLLEKVAP